MRRCGTCAPPRTSAAGPGHRRSSPRRGCGWPRCSTSGAGRRRRSGRSTPPSTPRPAWTGPGAGRSGALSCCSSAGSTRRWRASSGRCPGCARPGTGCGPSGGWPYGLQGDVPRALEHLDRAEGMLRRLGAQVGFLLEDRAGLLLSVGLVAEARLAAQQAVTALLGERQRIALPDARLLEARAAVLEGDRPAAEAQARRAAGPDRDRIRLGPLHRTADQLDAAGYPEAAVETRLLAAELAAERGGGDRGAAQLARAAAARTRGPAAIR